MKEVFRVFSDAWKVDDLRKKILYVMMILFVYRIGANIPMPGIDLSMWQFHRSGFGGGDGGLFGNTLFATIAGGGFGTIFAMGIGPYITASIIMQLLSVAIPRLEQMKKEGEEGKRKINQITKIIAVVMAVLQGTGLVFSFNQMGLFVYPTFTTYLIAMVSLVTGTIMVMWLGELITEKGIGNGTSFMIFSNILSVLPGAIFGLWNMAQFGITNEDGSWLQVVIIVLLAILFFILICMAILIQEGERRIPVQNSKKTAGTTTHAGSNSSFIPIKVNIAGVMAIIFSLSILQFPAMILSITPDNTTLQTIVSWLELTSPLGAILYMGLIIAFTFFYTSFAVNPREMAENLKKNGGFIPGIRPGAPTSEYIERTIHRISWIGAISYVLLAMIPVAFEVIIGFVPGVLPITVGFGGTTLLIVTGVALELVKKLQSNMLTRHYKGFLE
ncbi:MAG: preprotein translocase subunit SecY [Defluviitaleaceae bacterium]|nr:preprotein translocase subunit SecY [Defluviitaleaceae bacterium]